MESLSIKKSIFYPFVNNICFFIVGCGGTGGYVVRDLARMVSLYNEKYGTQSSMILCDADEVKQS